jgi:hypothetical protein
LSYLWIEFRATSDPMVSWLRLATAQSAGVIVDAYSPAPVPRNCCRAGAKSPLGSPCRYSSGTTSLICGDLRAAASLRLIHTF